MLVVRKPGAKGNRKLVDQHGDRLVRMRYRHGPADKTVEFIVEESRWRLSLVSALSCLVCTHAHRRIYKDLQHNINADGI